MALSQEAHEFNEQQKRYRENAHLHKHTAGADHKEMMAELKRLNNSIGFLIDTVVQWIKDEEKRREDEHRRSTYGMWDSQKYRTQRDGYDYLANTKPYRAPVWPKGQPGSNRGSPRNEPVPPYDPNTDPDRDDRDFFDEGTEDGKGQN